MAAQMETGEIPVFYVIQFFAEKVLLITSAFFAVLIYILRFILYSSRIRQVVSLQSDHYMVK